ncbi:MAG: hypothetical protein IT235_02055, partial [Bacteroidia bacterium]|nr:hypothetical protein [Bacteroidia bacterium]
MKTRVVLTASKAKAVQVIQYRNYKRVVLKHIGSARTADELKELLFIAEEWIKDYSGHLSLFPNENPNQLLPLNYSSFQGIEYRLFYETIQKLLNNLGLQHLPNILKDLVAIRIFEPASKLRSIEL